jgi:hypothetical protein
MNSEIRIRRGVNPPTALVIPYLKLAIYSISTAGQMVKINWEKANSQRSDRSDLPQPWVAVGQKILGFG